MSELRWTLLILGVVFIAALSWWERRRPRQAFAPRLREATLSHGDAQRTAGPAPAVAGEPWIGEAGLSDAVSPELTLSDADDDPAGGSGIHAPVESSAPGPLEELPTLVIPDEDARHAFEAAWSEQPPEPKLIDPEAGEREEAAIAALEPIEAAQPTEEAEEEAIEQLEPITATEPSQSEIAGAEGVGAVRIVDSAPDANGAVAAEPIVDWPPEESRRILALRLVAPQAERFAGRAVRLALAAEGFLLGKFSIFHKPDDANRAVLSAASLTRPGAFDLETMDSQRYGGLSLFAVIPGPKTPAQAFEDLLATARNLNERLEGALQDERGGPLTPLRVAAIRESVRAETATLPAAHEA
ncbi:MAG: cell division protein ZipA C-terminal FtsZ-binding domain-containing protein [Steroidobacteraceae bacterium]